MFEKLIDKLQNDTYISLETTPSHEPSINTIINKIKLYDLNKK